MSLSVFMFYLLSGIILIFSVMSVTTRRILRAAVYLLFVLVATSGLYFMLKYEFMAAVQLTLYAGGIVVLIIFSILLTHHISHRFTRPSLTNLLMGIGVAVTGSAVVLATLLTHPFKASTTELPVDMALIGNQLLSTGKNGYALPVELIRNLMMYIMIVGIIVRKKEKNKNSEI